MPTGEDSSKNLEMIYKSFINETEPLSFFTCLVDYINYIFENPPLKKIIDKEMTKRQVECDKEMTLENKSIEELRKVKTKILKIIEDKKISPLDLQGEWSFPPATKGTILDDLKAFENGEITTSTPYSNALEHYLYQIAVGISKQGYGKLLKEFEDPHGFNIYGNFIFSKTLKEREQQTKNIDIAEDFEMWGCVNQLGKFRSAYTEAAKNSNYMEVMEKYIKEKNRTFGLKDAVEITHLTEDLKKVRVGKAQNTFLFLNLKKMKDYATRVKNYLIMESTKDTDDEDNDIKKSLKSLHLVTNRLEPTDVIFLVLDRRFENPIRCEIKNNTGGTTYIKKLYDIAYIANAPGKRVDYDKKIADNINNGLFKMKEVSKYMRTNNFGKPTLVQKSKDDTLVLKSGIVSVKTELIKNIPSQLQYLYLDKTI